MSVLYIVIPLAFLIAAIAVGAFVWAARRGDFDDLETPAVRAILDDDDDVERTASQQSTEVKMRTDANPQEK